MSPTRATSYQLLIELAAPERIRVGRLGCFDFAAGRYVYTGSAKCHLESRIARHLAQRKRMRWHIDYLLAASSARVVVTLRFLADECEVNGCTPGRILVPGFGASDCRAACGSHLKFLGTGR